VHALTIYQPFASAIVHGPKRVENRTWKPPRRWRYPFDLAIHAAKRRMRADEFHAVLDLWPGLLHWPTVLGAVIGVAEVEGYFEPQPSDFHANAWVSGPVCWNLRNVRALAEPVACLGKQGLWRLPPEVEPLVTEQLP
jgi:hypothetical protein